MSSGWVTKITSQAQETQVATSCLLTAVLEVDCSFTQLYLRCRLRFSQSSSTPRIVIPCKAAAAPISLSKWNCNQTVPQDLQIPRHCSLNVWSRSKPRQSKCQLGPCKMRRMRLWQDRSAVGRHAESYYLEKSFPGSITGAACGNASSSKPLPP